MRRPRCRRPASRIEPVRPVRPAAPGAASNQPPTAPPPLTGASALQVRRAGRGRWCQQPPRITATRGRKTAPCACPPKARQPRVGRRGGQPPQHHRRQGKTTTTALTDAEIEKFTALVQQASASTSSAATRCKGWRQRARSRWSRRPPGEPCRSTQPWFQDLMRAGLRAGGAGPGWRWCGVRGDPPGPLRQTPPARTGHASGGQLDAVVSSDAENRPSTATCGTRPRRAPTAS